MTKINSLRNEKGQFQTTTNTTEYKAVQFNNRRMSEHARAMCIALNITFIPKGFIVHHIDENKRNNDINNLALMTITAHNRIHSHEAWNKDIKTPKNTVFKQRKAREDNYLPKFIETYKMLGEGKTIIQIAKELKKTRATIYNRIKKYEQLVLGRKN